MPKPCSAYIQANNVSKIDEAKNFKLKKSSI